MKVPVKKTALVKRNRTAVPSRARAVAPRRRRRSKQTLTRFVVLATSTNSASTPKNSSGWVATLTGGPTPISAEFDDFGVVRFDTISTLTTIPYTLRIVDENGTTLTNKSIPAGREFYVARF